MEMKQELLELRKEAEEKNRAAIEMQAPWNKRKEEQALLTSVMKRGTGLRKASKNRLEMNIERMKENPKDLEGKRIAAYALLVSFKKKPGDDTQ